jgi:hypothetical protein
MQIRIYRGFTISLKVEFYFILLFYLKLLFFSLKRITNTFSNFIAILDPDTDSGKPNQCGS